jgi:putative membrane protein
MMDGYYGGSGMGTGGYVLMTLLVLGFWAVVVFGAILAFRALSHPSAGHQQSAPPSPPPSPTADAERLLAERFARGEIDVDEYTLRRDLLRSR